MVKLILPNFRGFGCPKVSVSPKTLFKYITNTKICLISKIRNKYNIGILTMVDRQGKFVDGLGEFSNRYVKDYINFDRASSL